MSQPLISPVLCAHFPALDLAAPDPALERELFEAAAFSWLPLIDAVDRLQDDGVDATFTLAVSPSLVALLDDGDLRQRLAVWLDDNNADAAEIFDRCGGDIPSVWKEQAEDGCLELIPVLSTGAILPLVATDACRMAHIQAALLAFERRFGFVATGAWLPECAFEPRLEKLLARFGIRYTIVTAAALEQGDSKPALAHWSPVLTTGGVACFGRDPAPLTQGTDLGDPSWRAYGNDPESSPMLAPKADPEVLGESARAFVRGRIEAAKAAEEALGADFEAAERPAVSVLAWRAETFGVRMPGGVAFFEAVLREAVAQEALETPARLVSRHPRMQRMMPGASSWGTGGYFADWLEPGTDFLHRHARRLERRLVARAAGSRLLAPGDRAELARDGLAEVAKGAPLEGLARRAALLAVRELLLAQSGDWLVYIHRGANAEHGIQRAKGLLDRAGKFVGQIAEGRPDRRFIEGARSHPAVSTVSLGTLGAHDSDDRGRR